MPQGTILASINKKNCVKWLCSSWVLLDNNRRENKPKLWVLIPDLDNGSTSWIYEVQLAPWLALQNFSTGRTSYEFILQRHI